MNHEPKTRTARSGLWRLVPVAVLIALFGLIFGTGLNRQINFDTLAVNYATLADIVALHPVLAGLGAMVLYAGATALSFPASWVLTVSVGLAFGWKIGTPIVIVGATIGAAILYGAARFAFADFFRARAGNTLNRMAAGFRGDAVSYMLFLRLAPVFPFTLVNVVPAILGVSFGTFVWTTFVGIIPGTLANTFAGSGLRSIVMERAHACAKNVPPCGDALGPGDLITPQILIAFALLAVVALIPVVLRRLRRARPDPRA